MVRYLPIRSKNDQEFFVDDEISESEKPPSHNNVNKLEMARTGPIPSNQKPFAEQIHRPELQLARNRS